MVIKHFILGYLEKKAQFQEQLPLYGAGGVGLAGALGGALSGENISDAIQRSLLYGALGAGTGYLGGEAAKQYGVESPRWLGAGGGGLAGAIGGAATARGLEESLKRALFYGGLGTGGGYLGGKAVEDLLKGQKGKSRPEAVAGPKPKSKKQKQPIKQIDKKQLKKDLEKHIKELDKPLTESDFAKGLAKKVGEKAVGFGSKYIGQKKRALGEMIGLLKRAPELIPEDPYFYNRLKKYFGKMINDSPKKPSKKPKK
jgi:hypothetical protein